MTIDYLLYMSQIKDQTQNLDMCLTGNRTWNLLVYKRILQPTEPQWPGQERIFLSPYMTFFFFYLSFWSGNLWGPSEILVGDIHLNTVDMCSSGWGPLPLKYYVVFSLTPIRCQCSFHLSRGSSLITYITCHFHSQAQDTTLLHFSPFLLNQMYLHRDI